MLTVSGLSISYAKLKFNVRLLVASNFSERQNRGRKYTCRGVRLRGLKIQDQQQKQDTSVVFSALLVSHVPRVSWAHVCFVSCQSLGTALVLAV